MPAPFDPQKLCGWLDRPERVAIARTFSRPLFATNPRLLGQAAEPNALLYKAWHEVLGGHPHYAAQTIGDCTSQASGHTVDLMQCVQIALGGSASIPKEICTEAVYGMGREIAGMLDEKGDGCFGSAVAKAVLQGVVPREGIGPYDGQRAQEWGSKGTPDAIKHQAKEYLVKQTAMVTTLDELDAALANGYPAIVCSMQGFTLERDGAGMCRAQGQWAHAMAIGGMRTRAGKREYLINQSWGSDVPSGPRTDDQPPFSFWIDAHTMGNMLAQRDSFTFSGFDGFPGQPLPASWTYKDFI